MAWHSYIILSTIILVTAFCLEPASAQNVPLQSNATPAYRSSNLPPIFVPGNKVVFSGKTLATTFLIQEVQGEWVLVSSGGAPAAWIHPASSDASWRLEQ
jgi:hypothetical protein